MKYYLFDPSGNITALIPVRTIEECLPEQATFVMSREPKCEQVGYVLPGADGYDLQLQMAGGEFCGNASLCTAAYHCLTTGLQKGDNNQVELLVSGSKQVLSCRIHCLEDKLFLGTIQMPRIQSISEFSFNNGCFPLVSMSGISHIIVPEAFGMDRAEASIKTWCSTLSADALGIMLLSEDYSCITPLVYVPASDTLFRENSCASGTSAVGAWLAAKTGKDISLSFKEPGGILTVSSSPTGEVALTNQIRFINAS